MKYNNAGWNDPYGRFYISREQVEEFTECKVTNKNREELVKRYVAAVESGIIAVESLVMRANVGDCIEVRLTNFLPETLPATEFQLETLTDNVGFHIHLVKFDVITSDGGANGYNNTSSVFYGETLIERYYANEELNACFFHDHFNPNSHQQHGVFGALIIEPKGSKYYDPRTGREIKYGTKAVISTPSGRMFREFALFVHDFALLFDKNGNPLNKPPFPGSHDDPGVMGINYSCEPLGERLKGKKGKDGDPAYVFSSRVHGDPVTPILETYPGDEIVIRLLDGAQEEQHAFNINGMKWKKEITDKRSTLVQAQSIGISEAFNIRIEDEYEAGDYLYYFGGQDDLWLGVWGIIRAYKDENDKLIPINYPSKCFNKIDKCKDKKVREFHIAAIQKDIIYNKYKDHDPDGLLFVPYEYKDDVINGNMEPTPLILRANKGKYIKVKLTNCFTKEIPYQDFPGVPVDEVITPSMRVGIRLLDEGGNLIKTNQGDEENPEPVDFEDKGEKGFNYRSERFFNRLINSDIADVFSSEVHGDPATPVFEAEPGERVIIRLLMPADKPRNTCFVLHGHKWRDQPNDRLSNIISARGAISVGNVFNIELLNGASKIPGDYLYRSGVIRWDIESGMWGIFRIKDMKNNS